MPRTIRQHRIVQPAHKVRMARPNHRHRQQSRIGHLFPASGLRAQLRSGIRLFRSTPGLSLYLVGALAIWLLTRSLVDHGLAASPLGAAAVGALRLLGIVVVVGLFFRRTGHLAQARAGLHRLRQLLAERRPWQEAPSPIRRQLYRLLGWALRVGR